MNKVGILGSTGKMGSALMALPSSPSLQLFALSRNNAASQESVLGSLHALIDFSHVDAVQKNLEMALNFQLPIVMGTTGLKDAEWHCIQEASLKIPILYSSNFSIGITLMKHFIHQYAQYLEGAYIDICETHHVEKKDLPSGTALNLASCFPGKKISLSPPTPRTKEDLVIHAHRLPAHPGSHIVQYTLKEERLSLHHEALSRTVYAEGALVALQFLLKQKSGLYAFSDVFAT